MGFTILQVAVSVTCTIILYLFSKFIKKTFTFLAIPGPPVDWLLRHEVNEFTSPNDKVFEFRTKWEHRYPRICRYFIGPMPIIALAHPESIKEVVSHKPPKHYLYRTMLGAWLGDGLLLANGDKWFRHRRMLTPAFHYNILNSFMSVYMRATRVMLQAVGRRSTERWYHCVTELHLILVSGHSSTVHWFSRVKLSN